MENIEIKRCHTIDDLRSVTSGYISTLNSSGGYDVRLVTPWTTYESVDNGVKIQRTTVVLRVSPSNHVTLLAYDTGSVIVSDLSTVYFTEEARTLKDAFRSFREKFHFKKPWYMYVLPSYYSW